MWTAGLLVDVIWVYASTVELSIVELRSGAAQHFRSQSDECEHQAIKIEGDCPASVDRA